MLEGWRKLIFRKNFLVAHRSYDDSGKDKIKILVKNPGKK